MNKFSLSPKLPTSTEPFSVTDLGNTHRRYSDTITRTLVDKSTSSLSSVTWPTSYVNDQINWYMGQTTEDILKLKNYAKWQRKYIDFQATYAAYLLGALTEEEFEADSEQYAPKIRDARPEEIAPEIERLSMLLDFELRPAELAEYFETEVSVVNDAIEQARLAVQHEDRSDKLIGK